MLPFLLCYERNRFDEDAKMAPGISRRASSMLRSNRLRAERSGSLPCHFRPWRRDRVSFSDSHPSYLITLSSYSDRHLARIEAEKRTVPRLIDAVPDIDPDRPVRVLPVRIVQEELHP
jgi:hypothetical protein